MKVNQFDVKSAFRYKKDIFRLDVAVNYLVCVQVTDRAQQLCYYLGCVHFGEEFAASHVFVNSRK